MDLQKVESVVYKMYFPSQVGFNKLLQLQSLASQLNLISTPNFSLAYVQCEDLSCALHCLLEGFEHLKLTGNHPQSLAKVITLV